MSNVVSPKPRGGQPGPVEIRRRNCVESPFSSRLDSESTGGVALGEQGLSIRGANPSQEFRQKGNTLKMYVIGTATTGSPNGVLLALYYDRFGVSRGTVVVRNADAVNFLQSNSPVFAPFKVRVRDGLNSLGEAILTHG
jgi:hypothetical protein